MKGGLRASRASLTRRCAARQAACPRTLGLTPPATADDVRAFLCCCVPVPAARNFQLLPKAGKQPPPPSPEPTGQPQGNRTNGTSGSPTNKHGHQPSGPEAPVQDQLLLLQVAPPASAPCAHSCKLQFQTAQAARLEFAVDVQQGLTGSPCTPIARAQDKTQYFPQDPSQQPFPPYSTDPKVTASVQVPLKVEVERRKRLFANQDIMYAPTLLDCRGLRPFLFAWLTRVIIDWATGISCMLKE